MSGVAAAIAGAAVVGAVASRNASKRAASTARQTSDDQLAYMAEAEENAREDINSLIPLATERRLQGQQQAMDLLGRSAPMTLNALQQGNMNAQNVLAGSMPQIQNALMGGPVNYNFMRPQGVNVDLEGLLAGVPNVWQAQPVQQQQPLSNIVPQQPSMPQNVDRNTLLNYLANIQGGGTGDAGIGGDNPRTNIFDQRQIR